jgi:prepilin signal peptidase PulO-like enzyme (type II secretory pathway)
MEIFGLMFAIFFGAVFGSYATLFAYRLPLNESCFGRFFGQKSRCPNCNCVIRTRDLIPLINWIFTLGRCAKCQTKIPKTHLFIEIATTILFAICYLKFSFSEEFIIYSLISVSLIILMATDFTHRHFPSSILNFLLTIGFANRVLIDGGITSSIFSAIIGILFATIFYQIFYKKTSGLFALQTQSFDYTKFILISSICLQPADFFLYFLSVMMVFTAIIFFDIPKKKGSFSYCLIIPFFWILFSPIS